MVLDDQRDGPVPARPRRKPASGTRGRVGRGAGAEGGDAVYGEGCGDEGGGEAESVRCFFFFLSFFLIFFFLFSHRGFFPVPPLCFVRGLNLFFFSFLSFPIRKVEA